MAPAVDLAQLKSTIVAGLAEHVSEEHKAATAHERARVVGLTVGRALVEARKAFPRSGPKAAGWGAFLADAGLEERTAQRWMALAGYVAEVPDTPAAIVSGIPSARAVQVAKAGIGPAVLPSQRIRLAPSTNLPNPRPSAPAPIVHREATRTIRGDSQIAPGDGEPVFVRDDDHGSAPAVHSRDQSRQLAFDWAGTAAAVKRDVAQAGVDEAAALVSEMCDRVPGLRRVLIAQLASGAS